MQHRRRRKPLQWDRQQQDKCPHQSKREFHPKIIRLRPVALQGSIECKAHPKARPAAFLRQAHHTAAMLLRNRAH